MLKRMVIGLPRSGTTWAANWLTYGGETCVHDPLYHTHYSEWQRFDGVSCSGISSWPEFVQAQKCPILILHRPWSEVEESLHNFDPGYNGWLDPDAERQLLRLERPGVMVMHWRNLFNRTKAGEIWDFLRMPAPFSPTRHGELAAMNIQPAEPVPSFADHALHSRLMAELREKRERARNVV
jgi:hypothetical protein